MKNARLTRETTAGFTLLELIVVIAIITLLAGVLTPLVKGSLDDAKVAKLVTLADTFKKASYKYFMDTDQLPDEVDGGTHNLWSATGAPTGWHGPYLEGPITAGTSPFGPSSAISVKGDLFGSTTANNGYSIGGTVISGADKGCEIVVTNVPDAIAIRVNDAVDGPSEANKDTTGMCEYGAVAAEGSAAGNRTVYIFLYQK